jgi:hypothetical protein
MEKQQSLKKKKKKKGVPSSPRKPPPATGELLRVEGAATDDVGEGIEAVCPHPHCRKQFVRKKSLVLHLR